MHERSWRRRERLARTGPRSTRQWRRHYLTCLTGRTRALGSTPCSQSLHTTGPASASQIHHHIQAYRVDSGSTIYLLADRVQLVGKMAPPQANSASTYRKSSTRVLLNGRTLSDNVFSTGETLHAYDQITADSACSFGTNSFAFRVVVVSSFS